MKPLILTSGMILGFTKDYADLTVEHFFRFVWGPLPSSDERASYLGPRTAGPARGHHWSDFASRWNLSENEDFRDLGLAEFCQQYETVELWFDTRPNAQLQLIWLLDYFRSFPETIARLKFRLVDLEMAALPRLGKWRPPTVDITEKELETASMSWLAY